MHATARARCSRLLALPACIELVKVKDEAIEAPSRAVFRLSLGPWLSSSTCTKIGDILLIFRNNTSWPTPSTTVTSKYGRLTGIPPPWFQLDKQDLSA